MSTRGHEAAAITGGPAARGAAWVPPAFDGRLLVGALGACALGVLLFLLGALQPYPAVEIADADSGRVLRYLPLDEDGPLRLGYVHSIYREPAWEEFRVRDGGFALVGIGSRSEAVLEYYARAEPIERGGGQYTIRVAGERHAELPVLVSALGDRTLYHAGHQWPLRNLAGDGARVRVRVAQPPRLAAWLTRPACHAWPCP